MGAPRAECFYIDSYAGFGRAATRNAALPYLFL
jgi:hypothetical protein